MTNEIVVIGSCPDPDLVVYDVITNTTICELFVQTVPSMMAMLILMLMILL